MPERDERRNPPNLQEGAQREHYRHPDTECDTRPQCEPGHLRRDPYGQQAGKHQRQTPLDHHPQCDPEHRPDQRQTGRLKKVGREEGPL